MASRALPTFSPDSHPFGQRILVFAFAALASTILLKIGQVQYLEVINLGLMLSMVVAFARRGYQATWFRPYLRIGALYALFVLAALALAVASLRFDFYVGDDLTPLRRPVVVSLARAIELMGNVSMMLYLANLFRQDAYWLRFAMRVYFWVGVASGLYSVLSYPLDVAGIVSLGVYSDSHRFRGFYNEGGPYGLYVVSLILVGIALYRKHWERGPKMIGAFGLLTISLVMSQSKAAYGAILFFSVMGIFLMGSLSRKLAMLLGAGVIAVIIFQATGVARLIVLYRTQSAAYERASRMRRTDANFVYGRVAGGFIVPRMIAAHPLTGIGWGNYGILRNSPEYRGASQFVPLADEPGLGLLGTAADLGLRLIALLLICLFLPAGYLRRRRVPFYALSVALWQPIVHIFGGQLNLTYPWIATALALGLAYCPDQPSLTSELPVVPLSRRIEATL